MCYFKDLERQNYKENYSVELLMLCTILKSHTILIVSQGSYLSALLDRTNFYYSLSPEPLLNISN